VRNITACYRAGTSATESFNIQPYADALFRYLVRNKYNQNLAENSRSRSKVAPTTTPGCEFTI